MIDELLTSPSYGLPMASISPVVVTSPYFSINPSRIGAIGKEDENDESEHGLMITSLSSQSHHLNSLEGRCRLANRRAIVRQRRQS